MNLIQLLSELRSDFDSLAPTPLLLALVASQDPSGFIFLNRTELAAVLASVDFINVKTYDYYGNWEYRTGPAAPLYSALPNNTLEKSEGMYVDWTIRYYGCRTDLLAKVSTKVL
jgi:GH18 family chitinase